MSAPRHSWLLPLVASLVIASGCHGVPHTCQELLEPCHALPRCCRDRVHILILNGVDPGNWANLPGLREYLIELGFNNTHQGQFYHAPQFAREMRCIRAADPEARFVVIGFSFGANAARNMVAKLQDDGVDVDLLVYLGGNTLNNTPTDRPANARRVVNILAQGWIWNGAELDGADNVQLGDTYHFGSPRHATTRELLARELAVVASEVPIIISEAEERLRGVEVPKAWGFLAPATALQQLPARTESGARAVESVESTSVRTASLRRGQ